MSEQGTTREEDPSDEWVYSKETDMWISARQQIAIEGSTFRRMVAVNIAHGDLPESVGQPSDLEHSSGEEESA